jgi:hypothetical protein
MRLGEAFSSATPIVVEPHIAPERAGVFPMFAPASLKPYEPPRARSPEEEREIETLRSRIFK